MLVTGAEVVPLSVANTACYLWRHPDQRRDDPRGDSERVHHAYAESLRYDQPTNLLGRFVRDPVEIRGQRLEPGQGVMFLWASGNRDEEEFERADEFDVSRRPKRTLSFGHGAHKCIGEHLGMLEGRVLLEEILALAPEYEVDESGTARAYGEFLHGYHRMPIAFEPRALPQSSLRRSARAAARATHGASPRRAPQHADSSTRPTAWSTPRAATRPRPHPPGERHP